MVILLGLLVVGRKRSGSSKCSEGTNHEPVGTGERYNFNSRDQVLITAAKTLLKKVAGAETTTPVQLASVNNLLDVLSSLPEVVSAGANISVLVSGPQQRFEDGTASHWWEIAAEGPRISISVVDISSDQRGAIASLR